MTSYEIRKLGEEDRLWVRAFLTEHWGAPGIAAHGEIHRADLLPGFLATAGGTPIGLVTFRTEGETCEVVSLNSLCERAGVGSALLGAVAGEAREGGCRRLFLITTNDNLTAARFYHGRGFTLRAVYRDALDVSRRLKPSIPLLGVDGIPLRHEVEFDLLLSPGGPS
jgi:GNAT superfamily N-acetyltransferase